MLGYLKIPSKSSASSSALIGLFGILVYESYPFWFNIFAFTTVFPTALLGGYLVARNNV